jgi:transcriptional regulator with XRE-family HTH domain
MSRLNSYILFYRFTDTLSRRSAHFLMFNKKASELGRRVRTMRERKGWSPQQLAERIPGVKQQSIDQLEQGKIGRPRYLPELAATLAVREEWLCTGKGRVATQVTPRSAGKNIDTGLFWDVVSEVERQLQLHRVLLDAAHKVKAIRAVYELMEAEESRAPRKLEAATRNIVRDEKYLKRSEK